MIDEGKQFFHAMERDYLVVPDIKHYTCIVDLLGRAGKVDEALKFAENIKIEKDEGFWGALLGACRIHGDIKSARKASVGHSELFPRKPGHYVLLSNVDARACMWNDAVNVRELMSTRRIRKVPGLSRIEINDKAYQFKVGDKSHQQSKEIFEMLMILSEILKQAGYISDKRSLLHDVNDD
jgi:pentatricopeptide repeat protein